MNSIFFKSVSFLVGLAALTIVGNALSARAETPNPDSPVVEHSKIGAAMLQGIEPSETAITTVNPSAVEPTVPQTPEDMSEQVDVERANLTDINEYQSDTQVQPSEAMSNDQPTLPDAANDVTAANPFPGTVSTSAASLTFQPETLPLPEMSSNEVDTTIAQTDIDPGRTTRGGASYVGIGGNIGLGGDTALGGGSFVINGKIGLTRSLSVRPTAVIGDDTVFLLPLTYDFTIRQPDPFEPVRYAPFVGGGVALSTDEDDNIGFLLTGGVDVPLSRQFVANGSINVGFIEDTTEVGLILGVGYTFVGF